MSRKILIVMLALILTALAACGNGSDNEDTQGTDEIKVLEVDFEVPEKAEVGETVALKAIVTYGDENVKDADEVNFEYWAQGNEEDSTKIESKNNEDGTYTAEVTFETDGVYEIYAHTTARDMHTMPKKSITIGQGASAEQDDEHGDHAEEGHEHGHTEGFAMHFVQPEDVKLNQESALTVHLQMDNQPLEAARVRYEIYKEDSEIHDWVDTEETTSGEYTSTYSFNEEGVYHIVIHVQNDEGLHEHTEKQIEVN